MRTIIGIVGIVLFLLGLSDVSYAMSVTTTKPIRVDFTLPLSPPFTLPARFLSEWVTFGAGDPVSEPSTVVLAATAVVIMGAVYLRRRRGSQVGLDPMTSFTMLGKNVIWVLRHGNSLGRWAMLLTYLRIELTRAFIVHGLRLKLSSEMVWGRRLSFPNYDVFAILFEEIYLPNMYSFRCAHSQPNIIDCGANIGAATAYFLTQHPEAIITAFEPDARTFQFLERNANQNGWRHVTLHQAALHRTEERMTFYSRPTAPLASGFRESISSSEAQATDLQTVRLSSYISRPVDLLKLDVEGAEIGIMEDLVESGKLSFFDQIIMEYHHHIEPGEDRLGHFLSLLEQNGFGYELRAPLDLPFPRGRQHNFMIYAYRRAERLARELEEPEGLHQACVVGSASSIGRSLAPRAPRRPPRVNQRHAAQIHARAGSGNRNGVSRRCASTARAGSR